MKPNAPPIHIRTIFLGILSRNSRDLIKFVRRSVPANKQALDVFFNEPKIYAYHITFYRNAFLLKRRDDKYITWRKSLDHHNCKKGADLSFVQCVHTFAPSNCLNNIDQQFKLFDTDVSNRRVSSCRIENRNMYSIEEFRWRNVSIYNVFRFSIRHEEKRLMDCLHLQKFCYNAGYPAN